MLKSFIILAYRHFIRTPLTSFIEVFGLTAAFTVAILILLWVSNELSYDKFNKHYERIYRLEESTDVHKRHPFFSLSDAEIIKQSSPEIEKVVLLRHDGKGRFYPLNDQYRQNYYNIELLFVDQSFLETFSLTFVQGNPATALNHGDAIILTESLTYTIFGKNNPIGEQLVHRGGEIVTVTGIIKDIPNFHMSFDGLRSNLAHQNRFLSDELREGFNLIYLLLHPDPDIPSLATKISTILDTRRLEHIREDYPNRKAYLRPLSDIYLKGGDVVEWDYSKHGDPQRVLAYASVVIVSLLLACMNFITLNSSRSIERIKEVGIKKTTGANRSSIFLQFQGEGLLTFLLSISLALVFAHSLLSPFNDLMNTTLSFSQLLTSELLLPMLGGLILLSFIATGLPAVYISYVRPVQALKGLIDNTHRNSRFRSLSLIIQFTLSILLTVVVVTIFRQINFMKDSDLGFSIDRLLTFKYDIRITSESTVRKALLNHPNITQISEATYNAVPGTNPLTKVPLVLFRFEEKEVLFKMTSVDNHYFDILDLQLIEGRLFEEYRKEDQVPLGEHYDIQNMIINETAKKALGLDDPLGKIGVRNANGQKFRIIGVIKDFHIYGLQNEIPPLIFLWRHYLNEYDILVKISAEDQALTIKFIEEQLQKISSFKPDISFVDHNFEEQYRSDDHFAELLTYLTLLVILIGSMGLLGVFMHTIKIRIKEIGIRKVLGASLPQIIKLLSGPILRAIILSSFVAIPIGVFFMENWLANYYYHINLDYSIILLAVGIVMAIAAITIGAKCWHASNKNPASLIRYE